MEKKIILNILVEIFNCKEKLNKSSTIEDDKKLGFQLSYFLTEQMNKSNGFASQNLWLDNVEWESLLFMSDYEIHGKGELWWGYRSNFDKMFSDDFSCQLELYNVKEKVEFKYNFKFQINGQEYFIKS